MISFRRELQNQMLKSTNDRQVIPARNGQERSAQSESLGLLNEGASSPTSLQKFQATLTLRFFIPPSPNAHEEAREDEEVE